MMTPLVTHDFILHIEKERLPSLRVMLAELESGLLHVERHTGSSVVDERPEWILELKASIKIYENIVSHYRNED